MIVPQPSINVVDTTLSPFITNLFVNNSETSVKQDDEYFLDVCLRHADDCRGV